MGVGSGLEGEGGFAEFGSDVGFFDPAPVAAGAGTVVGAVFACEVAEVVAVFKGLEDCLGGVLDGFGGLAGFSG